MDADDEGRRWAERLRGLAPFAAALADPTFTFGAWHDSRRNDDGSYSMPWFEPSTDAMAVLGAVGRFGWILPGFDWRTWMETDEGRRLSGDPAAIGAATPMQLARLFTAMIRSDRFVEGSLEGAYESGLLGRALDRVAELAAER